ncbi:MAG: nucleotidyltransferase domain-containing protein [Thermodesulfovibrio sp.]|nr:nucleotidyltransferase domain-containing protein [Thermodesulfovibrio sp.]
MQKDVINIIKERLIETYKPIAIYLFGSRAWGKPDENSDFDILIIVESSEEKPYKRILKGLHSLRGLMVAKDILVYTKDEFENLATDISTLCYKIKKEGIKLYEAI